MDVEFSKWINLREISLRKANGDWERIFTHAGKGFVQSNEWYNDENMSKFVLGGKFPALLLWRLCLGKVDLLCRWWGVGWWGWRCLEKSSYFYRAPVEDIGKFSMPPSKFLKLSMPPPPSSPESGIEGVQSGILSYRRYKLQFLKMSDILKHMLLLNKNTDFLLLSPQYRQMKWHRL